MKHMMKVSGGILALFLTALPTAWAADKIGVVDVARVINEYEAARVAEARLEERAEEFSAENEQLLKRHELLKREFETLRDESLDPALTDIAREARRRAAEAKLQEVAEFEQEIRELTAMRRRQLEQQRQRVFVSLIDAIRGAIARQAETDGYTLILDSSTVTGTVGSVLYHQAAYDITTTVINRLNAAMGAEQAVEQPEPEAP